MNQSTRYITSIRSVNPDCKFFPSQGVVTASSSPRSPNQNQDWSIRRPRNKKHTRKSAKSHEFEHVFFGEEVKKENHHFFLFLLVFVEIFICRFATSRHMPNN